MPARMAIDSDSDDEIVAAAAAAEEDAFAPAAAPMAAKPKGPHRVAVGKIELREVLRAITFHKAKKVRFGDDDEAAAKALKTVQIEVLCAAPILSADEGLETGAPPMELFGYGATIQTMVRGNFTGVLLHYEEGGVRSGTSAIKCDVDGLAEGECRVSHVECADLLEELSGSGGNVVLTFVDDRVEVVDDNGDDDDGAAATCSAELVTTDCGEPSFRSRTIIPVMFEAPPPRFATLVADNETLDAMRGVVRSGRESHSLAVHCGKRDDRVVVIGAESEGKAKKKKVTWSRRDHRGVINLRSVHHKRSGDAAGGDAKRMRPDGMGLGLPMPNVTLNGAPAAAAVGGGIPADADAPPRNPFAAAAARKRIDTKIASMTKKYDLGVDLLSILTALNAVHESVSVVWLHLFDGILVVSVRLLSGTLLGLCMQGRVSEKE